MKVLKIGAVWCSGCLVMGPRWKKIEKENPWLDTIYFDYDSNPDVVNKYDLEDGKLPAFIFLDKEENEIDRVFGEIREKKILELIETHKDK